MTKRVSKRLSILTEEEREKQLYAEKCYNIGWELKNRGENESAIWHFEEHLNNMIIPASPLRLIELYPETEDYRNEINALNKYIKIANDYNYRLYLQALKEYPELKNQLLNALETNTNLIINEKQILRQQKVSEYIWLLDNFTQKANDKS